MFPNSSGATARIINIVRFFAARNNDVLVVIPYTYEGTKKHYEEMFANGKVRFLRLFRQSVPQPSEETTSGKWMLLRGLRNILPFNIMLFSPQLMVRLYYEAKRARPDVILAEFDGSWLVAYVLGKLLKSPIIIDKHNVETILYYRTLKKKKPRLSLLERLKVRLVLLMETLAWRKSEGIIAVSDHDEKVARQLFGFKAYVTTAPNGVDPSEMWQCQKNQAIREWLQVPLECKIMIFHGLASYEPNADARQRILNNILPLVRKLSNDDVFAVIVGPGHSLPYRIQKQDHARLVGEVSKSTLYNILCSSDVAVVPLGSGSGTRIKILEYFIANVPVVATSVAAEGLPAKDGIELLTRDEDQKIAEAIIELLTNDQLCKRLAENARRLAETRFDWQVTLKPIEELMTHVSSRTL